MSQPPRLMATVAAVNSPQLESKPLLEGRQRQPSGLKAIIKELRGQQRLWTVVLFSTLAANTAMLGGYTLGYPSASILDLRHINDSRSMMHDPVMENLFGAMAPFGSLIAGAMAGWSADTFGRKPTLIISNFPNFIGWLSLGLSWYITNKTWFDVVLLIGRFFTGFGIGWPMFCAPVYIAEVSSPALRGMFSSLPLFVLNIGILLVYSAGLIPGVKFYHTALAACVITVLVFIGTFFLQETPRYLVTINKYDEAEKSLRILRGRKVDVKEELEEIKDAVRQGRVGLLGAVLQFNKRDVWLPFVLILFLMFFRQFSGINALIFYSDSILKSAGFGSDTKLVSLLTVGVTEVLLTFVSTLIVDFCGRKILLIISAAMMAMSCAGLGIGSYFEIDCTLCPTLTQLTGASLMIFIIGVSIGFDSIPYILIAEMLPLRVRGSLGGLLSAFHWLFAMIVAGFYLFYAELDTAITWWSFALINIFAVAFVALFLPETKGKKLEDVQKEMYTYRFCS